MELEYLPINQYPTQYDPLDFIVVDGKTREVVSVKAMISGQLKEVIKIGGI